MYNECIKNEKIVIVINNPCFEYWFLLHFKQTSKFYNTYEPHLKKDLQKVLSDYEKTEKYYKNQRLNIYERLKPNLQAAISNSEKLGGLDFNKIQVEGIAEMYAELDTGEKEWKKCSYLFHSTRTFPIGF